jgi:class 3 adenylate cyclase
MNLVKTNSLRVASFLLSALGLLCFCGIVGVLGVQLMNNFFQKGAHWGVWSYADRYVKIYEMPYIDWIHAHLPSHAGHFDLAPAMLGAVLLAFCLLFDWLSHRVKVYRIALEELARLADKQAALNRSDVAAQLVADAHPDASKRDKVLELYAQTKKILDEQKRNVAFLSVDVVNSTGMKHSEDHALAELDFRHYRKFVEQIIADNKALKAAWTPDGVMICFSTLDEAVHAGQSLINGLVKFNKEVKTMKMDFAVRCGVNSGDVLYDESVKMEEMSDECIDLAGHMQKYATIGTLYVAESLMPKIKDQSGFASANRKVDGVPVFEWRSSVAAGAQKS